MSVTQTLPERTVVVPVVRDNHWGQLSLLLAGTSLFGNGTLGITKALLSVLLKSLGFSAAEIGLIAGARGFKAIADLPAGYLSDRYGRKRIAFIGQFLLVIAHWIMGFGSSFGALFTGRLVHGAGAGFNAGAATFGAADLVKKARGFGQGILETANYGSHTLFAALAGILAVRYGLRAPFFILGLAPIVGFFLIWRFMKEPRDLGSERIGPRNVAFREAGAFAGSLLRSPRLLALFYMGLLTKFVDDGVLTVLMPLWLTAQGAGIGAVALAATLAHGTFTATVALAGLFADWKGRRMAMVLGSALFTAGAFIMPHATSVWYISLLGMLIGLGNALVYPAAPAATADVVPAHLRGTGMSVYKCVHDAGVFAGPVVVGLCISQFGLATAFAVTGVIFVLGMMAVLVFFTERGREG